jgi:RNA-directed DNA polymerase
VDQVRARTRRHIPLETQELIGELNPLLRGWGEYYKRAHVRKLFHRFDGWISRRIWALRHRRWRCAGWKDLAQHGYTGSTDWSTLFS